VSYAHSGDCTRVHAQITHTCMHARTHSQSHTKDTYESTARKVAIVTSRHELCSSATRKQRNQQCTSQMRTRSHQQQPQPRHRTHARAQSTRLRSRRDRDIAVYDRRALVIAHYMTTQFIRPHPHTSLRVHARKVDGFSQRCRFAALERVHVGLQHTMTVREESLVVECTPAGTQHQPARQSHHAHARDAKVWR
jgi:hypothetical protein